MATLFGRAKQLNRRAAKIADVTSEGGAHWVGIEAMQDKLEAIEEAAEDALGEALFLEGEHIAENAREETAPVDQGHLRSSIHVRPPAPGPIVRCVAGGSSAPYALYVHEGTRPHWPPFEPILEWARRHGMDEDGARAVQRKIAREGTEANRYWTRALNDRDGNFEARVKAAYSDVLRSRLFG